MMNCAVVVTAAIIAIAGSFVEATAQSIPSTPVYEGNTTIIEKSGLAQAVHISVQSWPIAGQEQQMPLPGFYVAHLLSGQISATIDGRMTQHLPGDYWTVGAGVVATVKAVGQVAVLETIVVSKR